MATVGRAYDQAIQRELRIEAKATGLLQVVAVGFAVVALIAANESLWIRAVAFVSAVYLVLATVGAFRLLSARARPQVVVRNASSDTAGVLETAVAADLLERASTANSNILYGIVTDLKVGAVAAAVTLGLVMLNLA